MFTRRIFLTGGTAVTALSLGFSAAGAETFPVELSEAEWRAKLTPDQFLVLRENATEEAFSSPLHLETRDGTYACAGCGHEVYAAADKFFSDSGWPAFTKGVGILTGPDAIYGNLLTATHCANCGGHQGHIFNDGPEPLGDRHCINGLSMTFTAA